MGKVSEIIKSAKTFLIIPAVTSTRYSNISSKDYCLSVVLTLGYIETSSLEVAFYLRLYFHQADEYGFRVIGSIDVIRTEAGFVYRQRVGFSSFTNLLKLLRNFKIKLVLPKTVEITQKHLNNCSKSLKTLTRVADGDYLNWLTRGTLLQIILICDLYGVSVSSEVDKHSLYTIGILNRAPYICGSLLNNGTNSSVIVIPLSYFYKHNLLYLLGKKPKHYTLRVNSEDIPIFGFTKKTTSILRKGSEINVNGIK
jgi:hypothetical protein